MNNFRQTYLSIKETIIKRKLGCNLINISIIQKYRNHAEI